MNPYLGEIRIFPFNFAPRGWAQCNGQLLSISQETALFSLLGTTYGGNGTTTFALPNLQGAVPMGTGNAPGLSQRVIGEQGGSADVTLILQQIPQHNHSFSADPAGKKESTDVANAVPAGGGASNLYSVNAGNVSMNASMLAQAGNSQPHENRQPYLTLNFCIALQGIYPPRG